MPCSDSSSSIALKLDSEERFVSFDFAKITCGREITAQSGYSKYCKGKSLEEILKIPYTQIVVDLKLADEEQKFVTYLEWDALRSTIVQYLGIDHAEIDQSRCLITSVDATEQGTEVALVILPPKELPKILPCSLGDKK
ncbi:MAG: hypothetical protein A2787_03625 [Omnitrophica WOR_2 bacterium RIFCSPHIGHO2_01_FULL_48_9]|nr:MAG: hypothetical protein A3D10_08460 [Omnitrophica WOR_2 bacterium RIFCSPHIGHO2_02_FULL_48_11]OGX32552.1 MAG: hypothetical protein A2787_03625 [Omnitrophica WOR_2 bacterium RIFCSPHIGHO2_01_FULL_48_9]